MKNILKYICIIILIFIMIWGIILAINFNRAIDFNKPILMQQNDLKSITLYTDKQKNVHQLKNKKYQGIGYSIEILYENDEIYTEEIYIIKKLVKKVEK